MEQPNTENEPLITVEGLVKNYLHEGKTIRVLRQVDLQIHRGDMLAITGSSGAGKTTLLQVLGTLDHPSKGKVRFGSVNPFVLRDRQRAQFRRRNIGFVFQFHHLLPQFSALENVAMPARIDRMPAAEAEAKARDLLEHMGLGHRLRHRPAELSGGEQQRVAVARALVMRPKVILADEPTGNLDMKTGSGIHDLLIELNEEFGTAMVFVTHDLRLAERLPRRLHLAQGVLGDGESIDSGDIPGAEDGESEPRESAE